MADLNALKESIINGKRKDAEAITNELLAAGVKPLQIINDGLIAGMQVVGVRFKANEFYVPEVLVAARAMQTAMNIVKPLLAVGDMKSPGTVAIGTVQGDLHDIGKNLVMMMLEGAGYEMIDLGVDVTPDKFVEAVKTNKANIVAMSALLTTTMPAMKTTIEALDSAGVRNDIRIIIGGAPVTQEFANEIGADAYAPDAASAVDKIKELVNA